ncbi:mycofactocin biosynthesis peptidyl-dipeptidase MftE [Rhodococcus sp. NPDC049939]|uniref:mycofactocin biosynthesis peptidyl-dipeptidase MftE n=1 Tax=Rhodococcus sp. NPDC049939 TaxID=3155511 RepID=UPI0033F4FCBE
MRDYEELADTVWPDINRGASTVVVPVGSVEQHGPHLPLDTDTVIASGVGRALPDVLVAPAIAYGASGEHEAFPGTVSLGSHALESLLVEYGRSACRWAGRILFVNGHGGNGSALVKAVTLLRYEGRDVAWVPCAVPDADAHAGRTETSMLLHLSPGRVKMSSAETGNEEPIESLLPRLREGGIVTVSANGVLGDPTGATAADGERIFSALVERVTKALARWEPGPDGRLR